MSEKNPQLLPSQDGSIPQEAIRPAAEGFVAQTYRELEDMERSALGFGDNEQSRNVYYDIKSLPDRLGFTKDGHVRVAWGADRQTLKTDHQYEQLARCIKSATKLGFKPESVKQYLMRSGNHKLVKAYEEAEPFDVNYSALWLIKQGVLTPGSKEYAERFLTAGQEHLTPPAVLLNSEDVRGRSEKDVLKITANSYFAQMDKEHQEEASSRLGALRQNDPEAIGQDSVPDCTICIPVAAFGEREEVLLRTLHTIADQENTGNVEVVIYANYVQDDETSPELIAEKNQMLRRLQGKIAERGTNAPKIRFVLEGYKPEDLSISRLRKDMMDVVAVDLQDRGADYGSPVLWLDADTTRLAKGFIGAHVETQKANPHSINLASSNVLFTMSDFDDESKEGSTAQKLAAYAELQRRRNNKESNGSAGYIEESGLSFTIGSYLFIGGVNAADPFNESTWLKTNGDVYAFQNRRIFGNKKGSDHRILRAARLYTSGRRQVAIADTLLRSDRRSLDEHLYFMHAPEDFTGHDNEVRAQKPNSTNTNTYSEEVVDSHMKEIDHYSWMPTDKKNDMEMQRRNIRARELLKLVNKKPQTRDRQRP